MFVVSFCDYWCIKTETTCLNTKSCKQFVCQGQPGQLFGQIKTGAKYFYCWNFKNLSMWYFHHCIKFTFPSQVRSCLYWYIPLKIIICSITSIYYLWCFIKVLLIYYCYYHSKVKLRMNEIEHIVLFNTDKIKTSARTTNKKRNPQRFELPNSLLKICIK